MLQVPLPVIHLRATIHTSTDSLDLFAYTYAGIGSVWHDARRDEKGRIGGGVSVAALQAARREGCRG